MKRWRTQAGDELVEVDGEFFVLSGGAVDRSYLPSESSVDDWLHRQRFRIEGDGLLCEFTGERWGGRETSETTVELTGLVALPSDPGSEHAALALLGRAHDAQAARARELAEADELRLASFRAALPEAPARLRFFFGHDAGAWVVRDADGAELWRDGTWEWLGRDLFHALKPVLAKAYPRRKVHFEVVVEGEDYLLYNPD